MATGAILHGIWVGDVANVAKRIETSALAGVNRVVTTATQITAIYNALFMVGKALSTSVSLLIKGPLYLTPILTNILCYSIDGKKRPSLKKATSFFNHQIANLCLIAITVSSLSLIVSGESILGGVSLIFMIAGVFQRNCWIPSFLNQGISGIGFVGRNIARLAFGDIGHGFTAFCEIVNLVYLRTLSLYSYFYPPKKFVLREGLISRPPASSSYKVDLSHLERKHSLPKAPAVDLQTLDEIFQTFDLQDSKNLEILRRLVKTDEHWKEYFSEQSSDREMREYVRSGLKRFITCVKNRAIKTGEITDYRSLDTRAKHIAARLPTLPREDQFFTLVRLALTSNYCPAGYLEKVRTLYFTVCNSIHEDSLEARLFQILGEGRRYLFHQMLYLVISTKRHYKQLEEHGFHKILATIKFIGDVDDNHLYNEYVNLLGPIFHLPEVDDAKQDALAAVDILYQRAVQYSYRNSGVDRFYNLRFIREWMDKAIKNREIPYTLLESWFIEQARETGKTKEKATEWVRENVVNPLTGEIRPRYIDFLLYKHRVLTTGC